MLDGVTPFPAEFAARYRERGYWTDRPLFDGFRDALRRYANQVALVDADGPVTYRQLDERSAHLARALLDLGLRPLDRIIVQLPNTAVFGYLYFALQRIGVAPVLALPGHRRRELTQFAEISGARALAVPAAARGFDFTAMAADVMAAQPGLETCLVLGAPGPLADPRFVRLEDLLEREPRTGPARCARSASTRPTPRCSCSPAARPGSPSSSPARTTTTCTTPRSPRRRARSARATCCSTCCRSSTTCRSAVPACRASCCPAGRSCSAPAPAPGTSSS